MIQYLWKWEGRIEVHLLPSYSAVGLPTARIRTASFALPTLWGLGPGSPGRLLPQSYPAHGPRSSGWRRGWGTSCGSRVWNRRTRRRSVPWALPVIWVGSGGNSQRVGEPVRGADVDGGGDVPTAWPQCPGLPDMVVRGLAERLRDPLSQASDRAGDQSCLIPLIPPCERLSNTGGVVRGDSGTKLVAEALKWAESRSWSPPNVIRH